MLSVHHYQPCSNNSPNTALEATGHSVHFLVSAVYTLWPAPQLGR